MRSQTKVILLIDRFPELSETFVRDQALALLEAGFDLEVHAQRAGTGDLDPRLQSRVRYVSSEAWMRRIERAPLPRQVKGRFRNWRARARDRRALELADIVLCHFGPNGLRASRSAKPGRRAQLWTIFHGYDLSSYILSEGRGVYRTLFAHGDRFLPISELWRSSLIELGCPQERILLARTGVDCDALPFAERTPGPVARILSVGRLVEKKGVEVALRALARLPRDAADWRYEIVGSGPLLEDLKRLAVELQLGERVQFVGSLDSAGVRRHLEAADIFLLPSLTAKNGDMEGIPVALMEAMASGACVVSTQHSGIPELVGHGACGLLAQEGDVDDLVVQLERALAEPALRLALARRARRKVETEFNQKTLQDQLAASIEDAAPRRPAVVGAR
ncbi:glycosyltransferase [Phenylobacterium sp. LjRoot225]|uniref:glycosyltransferase n=1 Tax=Phenylobacterium sp. LjRoot225 TaxID=3342285 RepID=UPI003ECF069F